MHVSRWLYRQRLIAEIQLIDTLANIRQGGGLRLRY